MRRSSVEIGFARGPIVTLSAAGSIGIEQLPLVDGGGLVVGGGVVLLPPQAVIATVATRAARAPPLGNARVRCSILRIIRGAVCPIFALEVRPRVVDYERG